MANVLGVIHIVVFDDGKIPMRVTGDIDESQVLNVVASQSYAIVKTFLKYGAGETARQTVCRFLGGKGIDDLTWVNDATLLELIQLIVKFGKAMQAKIKKEDNLIWTPDIIGGPFGN